MHRDAAIGILLTVLSLTGYTIGIIGTYPGRAFTVTGAMVGIALYAVRRNR